MLRSIPYAGSRAESEHLKTVFAGWCHERPTTRLPKVLSGTGNGWLRSTTYGQALEALEDYERCGVAICCAEAAHRCGEAVQESGQGDSGDLEDADGC